MGIEYNSKLQADNELNKIEILCLNVCSLVSKSRNPYFVESISFHDIICSTETKIDKYDDVCTFLEGFYFASILS